MSPRPVVLTLRKPTGEFIRKTGAYPTACPGVYRFPMPDECESCYDYEEFGICLGGCGSPVTFSWCMACEAGVILSSFAWQKSSIETITARLAETQMDFTLPFPEVVEAARGPEAENVRRILSFSLADEVASS